MLQAIAITLAAIRGVKKRDLPKFSPVPRPAHVKEARRTPADKIRAVGKLIARSKG